MSDESKTTDTVSKIAWPQGIEWLWWGLLVVSLAVGFGMTIFAPT